MDPWLEKFLSVGQLRSVSVSGSEVPVEHPSVALLSRLAQDQSLPSESRVLTIQGRALDARVEVYGSGPHQTLAIKSAPATDPAQTGPSLHVAARSRP